MSLLPPSTATDAGLTTPSPAPSLPTAAPTPPPSDSAAPRDAANARAPSSSVHVSADLAPHNVPERVRPSACCLTLRALVSKKKLRFIGRGVDLDLSYITDRIVAMGFPSQGVEACYRNPVADVRDFLEARHPGHYRIWNLCSEREYGAGHFPCEVERFSWADHTPPPFALVRARVRATARGTIAFRLLLARHDRHARCLHAVL